MKNVLRNTKQITRGIMNISFLFHFVSSFIHLDIIMYDIGTYLYFYFY